DAERGSGGGDAPAADVGAAVRARPGRLPGRHRAAPDPAVAPHGQRRSTAHHAGRAGGQHGRRRVLPPGDLAARGGRVHHLDLGLAAGPAGPEHRIPPGAGAGRLGDLQRGGGDRRPPAPRRPPRPRRPRCAAELGHRLPRPRRRPDRGRPAGAPGRRAHPGAPGRAPAAEFGEPL
ncbi:MAG: hypothetical protein AVDCRST_MAG57-210, partial [uncultured Blastococcus sp.]